PVAKRGVENTDCVHAIPLPAMVPAESPSRPIYLYSTFDNSALYSPGRRTEVLRGSGGITGFSDRGAREQFLPRRRKAVPQPAGRQSDDPKARRLAGPAALPPVRPAGAAHRCGP